MKLKKTLETQIRHVYLKSKPKDKESIVSLKGKSMHPTLKDGYKVKLKTVELNEINCGDIVIFAKDKMTCHRIIGKFRWLKKIYFIHSGDAVSSHGVFAQDDLVGKVVDVIDKQGNKIDKTIWQRPGRVAKISNLGYIYLPLFILKRLIFGKKQNKFNRWSRMVFWRFYDRFLKK